MMYLPQNTLAPSAGLGSFGTGIAPPSTPPTAEERAAHAAELAARAGQPNTAVAQWISATPTRPDALVHSGDAPTLGITVPTRVWVTGGVMVIGYFLLRDWLRQRRQRKAAA